MFNIRTCLFCGAFFKGDTLENTLNRLKSHQNTCTKDNNFTNDTNADGYENLIDL